MEEEKAKVAGLIAAVSIPLVELVVLVRGATAPSGIPWCT